MPQYIWENREIEKVLKRELIESLGESHGDVRFGCYTKARENLLINVLPEITRLQRNLTDHGPIHICDVLDNAYELLGNEISSLNCMELYCLVMAIIFHDVGNFFDRNEHRKLISQIYDLARPSNNTSEDAEEKIIILNICEAHCGKQSDGSTIDTLKKVIRHSKLERKEVRPYILAPILRFADELAEGGQRTSYYMIKKHNYLACSMIYHKYSQSTKIDIDRNDNRICLTNYIKLKPSDENDNPGIISMNELKEFLAFIYKRAEKLNQERQYAKYFCSLLDPFKRTSVTINFSCFEISDFGTYHEKFLDIPINSIEMSDLVVPGDHTRSLTDYDKSYDPDTIINYVNNAIKK